MKKVVLKVQVTNDREKQKAMTAVSSLQGVDSITLDLKDQKLTVIGDVDPVDVVKRLRKRYFTEILTVGPAKEPDKKKGKEKKEEPEKDESKKKEGKKDEVEELVNAYKAYNPKYISAVNADDDPNACVIC